MVQRVVEFPGVNVRMLTWAIALEINETAVYLSLVVDQVIFTSCNRVRKTGNGPSKAHEDDVDPHPGDK